MSAPTLHAIQRSTWSLRELRGLVTAEVRKMLSTSAWWAGLLLPAGLLCLVVGLFSGRSGSAAANLQGYLGFVGVSVAILLGVVCASAEYRHNTIATSYLGAADRPKLIIAKAAFAAMVGAAWALIAAAMSVAGVLIGGADLGSDLTSVLGMSAAAVPVFAVGAVLGVGFGTWIGNQMLAVLGALLYMAIGEFLLVIGAEAVDLADYLAYLPRLSGIISVAALAGTMEFDGGFGVSPPWWLLPLVFLGWTALFGLAGAAAAQRRDIA